MKVSTKYCKRIWDRYIETIDTNGIGGNVDSRKNNSGKKGVQQNKLKQQKFYYYFSR